jgi:hypothetical protein
MTGGDAARIRKMPAASGSVARVGIGRQRGDRFGCAGYDIQKSIWPAFTMSSRLTPRTSVSTATD